MGGGGAMGRYFDDGKNGLFMAKGMCAQRWMHMKDIVFGSSLCV